MAKQISSLGARSFYKKAGKLLLYLILLLSLESNAVAISAMGIVVGYSGCGQDGIYPPESYNYRAFTHIIRTGLSNFADGSIVIPDGFFNIFLEKQAHLHGIKFLAALTGSRGQGANDWLSMCRNPLAESALFNNLEKIIVDHHYDGVDIDWEPGAGNDEDQAVYTQFVKDLRHRFPKWLISVDLWAGNDFYASHVSWKEISDLVDWINLMEYDFVTNGPRRATHNANLYTPTDPKSYGPSIDSSLSPLLGKYHLPPEKTVLGLAFYGRVIFSDHMGGPFLEGVTQLGPEINYYEISPLLKMKNYIALRDDSAKAPYLESVGGGEVITYDDAESTHLKCEYALSHGLKGVFMWTMGSDVAGDRTPLLDAVCQTMGYPLAPIPTEGLEISSRTLINWVRTARLNLIVAHNQLFQTGKTDEANAADPGPEPDLSAPTSNNHEAWGKNVWRLQTLLTTYKRKLEKAQMSIVK